MRFKHVKTSNHELLIASITSMLGRAPKEARILLLAGEPGTGKSCSVDNIGAAQNALHIEGMPGMTVSYLRDLLAYELGCAGGTKFMQQKCINDTFAQRHPMVILDEAQHGLDKKADCIEYLRRICEQAGCVLILVCHTSEKHRFGEHKLAHIATRISTLVEFVPATLADTVLYLHDLCEVSVTEGVAAQALLQSRGRYRLLSNACRTLEDIGAALGKTQLTDADVKGMMLCEDAMKSLRKGK
jgi:type II secretory pathway predicted ATPase ExeA